MKTLAVTAPVTLAVCILRMTTIRHPFYEPGMWSYRHLIPVLLLIAAVECILATEHVLEESFIGSALYSRGLAYFITDNAARYGAALDSVAVSADPAGYASAAGQFAAGITEISLKQLYGIAAYASVLLFLLFLLYDSPVRRHLKLMPAWRSVRDDIASTFGRRIRSMH